MPPAARLLLLVRVSTLKKLGPTAQQQELVGIGTDYRSF